MQIKIKILIILALIFCMIIPQAAVARKNVGLIWDTQTEIVFEGSTHCTQYGVYNPWDEDVNVVLSVSEELKDVIRAENSDGEFVPTRTLHENSIPIEFCFKVANVYEKDCLIGDFFCKKTCGEDDLAFEGKVIAMEKTETKEKIPLGVSVPIIIKVKCEGEYTDLSTIYSAVGAIAILALLIIVILSYFRKRKAELIEI
ncbi:MAG: hypothetical protein GY861_09060 [bacterium]|nr:hypothetical protein [bacterium]